MVLLRASLNNFDVIFSQPSTLSTLLYQHILYLKGHILKKYVLMVPAASKQRNIASLLPTLSIITDFFYLFYTHVIAYKDIKLTCNHLFNQHYVSSIQANKALRALIEMKSFSCSISSMEYISVVSCVAFYVREFEYCHDRSE